MADLWYWTVDLWVRGLNCEGDGRLVGAMKGGATTGRLDLLDQTPVTLSNTIGNPCMNKRSNDATTVQRLSSIFRRKKKKAK